MVSAWVQTKGPSMTQQKEVIGNPLTSAGCKSEDDNEALFRFALLSRHVCLHCLLWEAPMSERGLTSGCHHGPAPSPSSACKTSPVPADVWPRRCFEGTQDGDFSLQPLVPFG